MTYRIIKRTDSSGYVTYHPQIRFLFLFWVSEWFFFEDHVTDTFMDLESAESYMEHQYGKKKKTVIKSYNGKW